MKKLLLITAIAALSTTTFADVVAASTELSFITIDTNLDGMVSVEEAANHEALAEIFANIDLDGDSSLSEAEFSLLDTDANGFVSSEELSMLTVHGK